MRTLSRFAVAGVAALVLGATGCQSDGGSGTTFDAEPSGSATATASASAGPSASASATATPTGQPDPAATLSIDVPPKESGEQLTAAMDTITCTGEPVSGLRVLDAAHDDRYPPYGPVPVSADNKAKTVVLKHYYRSASTYELDIWCGRTVGGSPLHLFRLPTMDKPDKPHTIVCETIKGCTVDGAKVTLR